MTVEKAVVDGRLDTVPTEALIQGGVIALFIGVITRVTHL